MKSNQLLLLTLLILNFTIEKVSAQVTKEKQANIAWIQGKFNQTEYTKNQIYIVSFEFNYSGDTLIYLSKTRRTNVPLNDSSRISLYEIKIPMSKVNFKAIKFDEPIDFSPVESLEIPTINNESCLVVSFWQKTYNGKIIEEKKPSLWTGDSGHRIYIPKLTINRHEDLKNRLISALVDLSKMCGSKGEKY